MFEDGSLSVFGAEERVGGVALLHAGVVLFVLVGVQHGGLVRPALRLRAGLGWPRRLCVFLLYLFLGLFFTITIEPCMRVTVTMSELMWLVLVLQLNRSSRCCQNASNHCSKEIESHLFRRPRLKQ